MNTLKKAIVSFVDFILLSDVFYFRSKQRSSLLDLIFCFVLTVVVECTYKVKLLLSKDLETKGLRQNVMWLRFTRPFYDNNKKTYQLVRK